MNDPSDPSAGRPALDEILALTGAIIVALDRNGRVTLINRAGADLLERRVEDLIGLDWIAEFIPERLRERVAETFSGLIGGAAVPSEFYENPIVTSRGERLISWHNAVRRDTDGRIIGTLSSGLDITERVEIATLRRAREILNNLFTFVALLKPDGTVLDVNRAPLDAGGLTREDVLGRSFWECSWWTHDVDVAARIRSACGRAALGEVLRFDVMLRDRHGCLMPIDFMIAPQRDADGRIAFLIPSAVDISERRLSEERLRRSESRYRETVEHLIEGIYSTRQGRFTSVNRAMCEIFGYAEAELLGMPAWELAVPERREEIRNAFFEIAARGGGGTIEAPCRRKDGRPIVIEVRLSGRSEDGEFFGLVIDVSERKTTEAALKESEERFRRLFEENSDALLWADPESGSIIDCNTAAEHLLDRPRGEIIGKDQAFLHPPEDLDDARETFRHHVRDGAGTNLDLRILRANGERVWVSIVATLVEVGGRRILQGCFRDLSERRRSEEERLRSLVQHSFDMILVVDGLGLIHYESPSVERVLGYSSGMNLGRNIMELVHQADRGVIKEALCRVVAAPGRAERIEIRVLHQDGAWRDLEAIGVAIQENGDLPRIVVNCRDITERKQTAQSLQESLDRIKAVEERRRNFLSAVAHDLRTPLAVTIGAVDGLLTGRPGNVSQEQERMLAIVRRNAERLGRLFENLLDLAHSESGEIRIEPDLIDLATPVASAVECFRPLLGGRSLTICYHPPPEPVMVRADQDRIIQIVFNLLENSMRYAASSLTVEVGRTPTGEAELAIANDGPPIDPEYLTRIFEPYFSPEATTKKGRSGLGLAIVKTIVELHGGRVAALNLDHGVRFSVTLPRATNNGSGAKSDAGLKTGVPSGNGKR